MNILDLSVTLNSHLKFTLICGYGVLYSGRMIQKAPQTTRVGALNRLLGPILHQVISGNNRHSSSIKA